MPTARILTAALLLLPAGCQAEEQAAVERANQAEGPAESVAEAPAGNEAAGPLPPVEPIPPGEPGGLPDDRAPISEAPFSETSAQGAANVVQSWAALVESGRAGEARALWSDPAAADAFLAGIGPTSELHAQIGAPGEIEGAAGSLFVEVPVQVYGRAQDGTSFSRLGTATLRRVNDVPGSTEAQRKWRINAVALSPLRPARARS